MTTRQKSILLSVSLALDAVALAVASVFSLRAEAQPGSAAHTSIARLGLFGGGLILAGGLAFAAYRAAKREDAIGWIERYPKLGKALTGLLGILFLVGWELAWTPLPRFGSFYYYALRLFPFAVWLTLASGLGFLLLLLMKMGVHGDSLRGFLRKQGRMYWVAGLAFAAMLLIGLYAMTRITTVTPQEEDFWYGADVPVLALQVLIALLAGLCLGWVEKRWKRFFQSRRADWLIFIVLWAATALLWVKTPFVDNFFVTMPGAPNVEYYPYADAQTFDVYSQFALIGQGLNNGAFYDRALYPAFLVYLHTLAGQNYLDVVSAQAAIFAVFAGLLYLLGKSLSNRAAGLGLAVLGALHGANAIVSGAWIDTSHTKLLLTDFPTAIGMLLLTLLVVEWLKAPDEKWHAGVAAAGVLGLTTMLRPHPLPIIGLILLAAAWLYRKRRKAMLAIVGLVLAAGVSGLLPWLATHPGSASGLYLSRIRSVVQQRYSETTPAAPATLAQPQTPSAGMTPTMETQPTAQPTHAAAAAPANTEPSQPPSATATLAKSVAAFTQDNFLNNLVMSFLGLPASFVNEDLRTVVKDGETYWEPYWDGHLSASAKVFIPINLLLLSLGLAWAWRKNRAAGLAPLVFFLAYQAVNALGRTSGGRYLVPVDWVVLVYYLLGFVAVGEAAAVLLGIQPKTAQQTKSMAPPASVLPHPWRRSLGVILTCLLVGAMVPLSGHLFPRRYPAVSPKQLTGEIVQGGYARALGVDQATLESFIGQNGVIYAGRALYPRFYGRDDILYFTDAVIRQKGFPRLDFLLLTPQKSVPVVLPELDSPQIPNAADVIVLGCENPNYVQALAVVVKGQPGLQRRWPDAPLSCPLALPVCNNNNQCH